MESIFQKLSSQKLSDYQGIPLVTEQYNASLFDVLSAQAKYSSQVTGANITKTIFDYDETFDKEEYFQSTLADRPELRDVFERNVENIQEADHFVNVIDAREKLDRAFSGANLAESFIGGVLGDIPALVALGVEASIMKGKTIAPKIVGGGLLKSQGFKSFKRGLFEGTAYEAFYRRGDPTRTITESAAVIGGGALLAGTVGAASSSLAKKKKFKGFAQAEKEMLGNATKASIVQRVAGGDLSAAQYAPDLFNLKNVTASSVFGKRVGDVVAKINSFISPRNAALTIQTNPYAKETLLKSMSPTLETNANSMGYATQQSMLEVIRQHETNLLNYQKSYQTSINKAVNAFSEMNGLGKLKSLSKKSEIEKDVVDKVGRLLVDDSLSTSDFANMADNAVNDYDRFIYEAAVDASQYYEGVRETAVNLGMDNFKARVNYRFLPFSATSIEDPVKKNQFMRLLNQEVEYRFNDAISKAADDVDNLSAVKNQMEHTLAVEENLIKDASDIGVTLGDLVDTESVTFKSLMDRLDKIKSTSKNSEQLKSLKLKVKQISKNFDDAVENLNSLEDLKKYIARDVIESLEGGSVSRDPFSGQNVSPTARYFNARIFDRKKFKDFIDYDFRRVSSMYNKKVAPYLALKKMHGISDPKKVIEDMASKTKRTSNALRQASADPVKASKYLAEDKFAKDIYDELGGDVKEIDDFIKKFEKDYKVAADSFSDMFKQMTGTYQAEFLRKYPRFNNLLRLNSSMLNFSQLNELAFTMTPEITGSFINHGFRPVKDVMKVFYKQATSKDFRKLSRQQLDEAGVAIQVIQNQINNNLIQEAGNQAALSPKFSGLYEKVNQNYYRMIGANQLDGFLRKVNMITQDAQLIDLVNDFENLKTNRKAFLARIGIDKSNYKRVRQVMNENIVDADGIRMINVSNINNTIPDVADVIFNARVRQHEMSMISVGVGDLPFFVAHPAVNLLFKFLSYPAVATTRFMSRGLQRPDANMLAWLSMTATMHTAIGELRYGKEVTGEDWVDKVSYGIDRSGYFGLFQDYGLNYALALAGVESGGAKHVGGDFLESLLGVSAINIKAVGELSSLGLAATDPDRDIEDQSLYNFKRALPFNQVFRRINNLVSD